jgi:hypothetical protein
MMKKFKEFIEQPIQIDEPIHFKGKDTETVKLDEPIQFKGPKRKALKEDSHSDDVFETSKRLRKRAEIKPEHRGHIREYTKDSADLNRSLAKHGSDSHLDEKNKKIHESIHASKHEAGEHLVLHSGVSARMGNRFLEHRGKIFHSPAHISASHDHDIAHEFMFNHNPGSMGERHLVHIHVKPNDKILHVSHHSASPDEHETIVPSGTHLKHLKTHSHTTIDGDTIVHHHFEIHKQE